MRGKELDTLIEHELQLMLFEGFDKSPISVKALHIRLKAKGIVNGGLSTLSSLERKRLIAAYVDQQLGPLNLRPKEKQQYVNRKTRQALLARNQQLQAEVLAKVKFAMPGMVHQGCRSGVVLWCSQIRFALLNAECLDTPGAGDWHGANIDYPSRHVRCGGAKYINNSLSRAPAKSHG